MKKARNILALIFIAGFIWLGALGGAYPEFHNFSGVTKVVLTVYKATPTNNWPNVAYAKTNTEWSTAYTYYERVLVSPSDIAECQKAIGVTWNGFPGVNSFESPGPRYKIIIFKGNKESEGLIFTNSEWDGGGNTPQRIIEYMKKTMS